MYINMADKTFEVKMPFAGTVSIEVTAENEAEAYQRFFEVFDASEHGLNDTDFEVAWDFHDNLDDPPIVDNEVEFFEIED